MIDYSRFVNHFHPKPETLEMLLNPTSDPQTQNSILPFEDINYLKGYDGQSFKAVDNLLSREEANCLLADLDGREWQAAGQHGYVEKPFDKIGNYRLSHYNPELAEMWFSRLKPFLKPARIMFDNTPCDHDGHSYWEPVGINPLMRFIRYVDDGMLVAHYDGPHVEDDEHSTLMSVVIYLTENTGGSTRFLYDKQHGMKVENMDLRDWDRGAELEEVAAEIFPSPGRAIVFDHRLLHDGAPLDKDDGPKVIIRTDIIFRKIR